MGKNLHTSSSVFSSAAGSTTASTTAGSTSAADHDVVKAKLLREALIPSREHFAQAALDALAAGESPQLVFDAFISDILREADPAFKKDPSVHSDSSSDSSPAGAVSAPAHSDSPAVPGSSVLAPPPPSSPDFDLILGKLSFELDSPLRADAAKAAIELLQAGEVPSQVYDTFLSDVIRTAEHQRQRDPSSSKHSTSSEDVHHRRAHRQRSRSPIRDALAAGSSIQRGRSPP